MNEDKYLFKKLPETYYYEFFSEGPTGKIKKAVRYSLIETVPYATYNLAFGDWNNELQDINDLITTNNQDTSKVLATVADTIIDFTTDLPGVYIFVQGSTDSRTRLYQMGIATFWKEINLIFIVIAYYKGEWVSFETGKNFEAFLIKRK